jgi:hypothetical protein
MVGALTLKAPAFADCHIPSVDTGQREHLFAPASRYVIDGEEVIDKETKLIWQRCSIGQHWRDGSGCEGTVQTFSLSDAILQASGRWRVPTADELMTLISENGCKTPFINEEVFPGMSDDRAADGDDPRSYWTSSRRYDPVQNETVTAEVPFYIGKPIWGGLRNRRYAVRLVQSGQ